MAKHRSPLAPTLVRTDNPKGDRNLRRVVRELDKLAPHAAGREIVVDLVVGDNLVTPPVRNPRGALVTNQTLQGNISSIGPHSDGRRWVIYSAVICTARLSFY